MRPLRSCAAAILLVVVAACAGPAPEPASESEPITIAVAGDVHFQGVLRARLDDPDTALAPATSTLAAADLAIVNLETSVGTGGTREPDKRFTFQAPPTAFTALAAAGIDVATMANNHALDYGREPLAGTFAAAEAARSADPRLDVVGIGPTADEAFRPALTSVRGVVVATLGASLADLDPTADSTGVWAATDSSPGVADAVDPTRLLAAVEQADDSADVVVVYLHWGVQGERCPTADQQGLAADLASAGADVIVGSHAHLLQGAGRLGDAYVAYGLGNYAWYGQSPAATAITGVLTLTVQPPDDRSGTATVTVTESTWEPARIGSDGLPAVMKASDRAAFEADMVDLRACAGLG